MATIQVIVTDQGNGGSYCSDCGYDLDNYLREKIISREPKICPKCQAALTKREEPWINMGGSDF
jgi:NAD-dependent SIR2 family protein deacetylase